MPIVDRELVGEELLRDEAQFSPENYFPAVHGQSIESYVIEKLKSNDDKPWMTNLTTGKSVRYSELSKIISRMSNWFRRRGLQPRDVILVTADNCVEIPLLFFAAWKAGACCGGLDVNMTADEIRNIVTEIKPRFIVADELRMQKVLQATSDAKVEVIPIGDMLDEHLANGDEYEELPDVETDLEAPAWIAFSSGTTGPPKPIIHTHRSLSPYLQRNEKHPIDSNFVYTNLMIHGSGLFCFLRAIACLASSYIFFEPTTEKLLEAIGRLQPSYISVRSFEVAELCQFPALADHDVSSVETILYTGSGVAPGHELEIFDKFPNLINVISMYGSSEIMILTFDDPKPKPPIGATREQVKSGHFVGSAGKVVKHVKIKIVDPATGEKQGPRQHGEIVAWSPFVMQGYFKRPEATAQVIRDGWYFTGDRGYFDENGNLFVAGRYKEMIKYRTVPVIPSSIEKHIMTHPAVIEAAVIGVPHDIDGERPMAYVVVKRNALGQPLATEDEIVSFTDALTTNVEKLRGGARFIEQLPRNTMGKVLRLKLSEMARNFSNA